MFLRVLVEAPRMSLTEEPSHFAYRQLGTGALVCGSYSTSMRLSTENLRYYLLLLSTKGRWHFRRWTRL